MRAQFLLCRAEANGALGAERPPGDHLSEILLSCRIFCELNVYSWMILRRDDAEKHDFISVKK